MSSERRFEALAKSVVGLWMCTGCSSGLKGSSSSEETTGPACASALLWVDEDLDGFGDASRPEEACLNTPGHSSMPGDCDDGRADVHPAMPEICNGIDDDCDGEVDMGLLIEVWSDLDGDGFGDPDTFERVCEPEPFHVRENTDCDDSSEGVNPAVQEICDGIDQNCDGAIDEDAIDRIEAFMDIDMDGMGGPDAPILSCPDAPGISLNDWDCDDTDPTTPLVVDAGASGGDGSLLQPLGSIQDAVDAAVAGSGTACVAVLPGRYGETLDLSKDDVVLVGVEGAERTVVDGFGLDAPVLTLGEGNQLDTLVAGLTLAKGTPDRYVLPLFIVGNRYDWVYDRGAGVYASGARATLRGLHIVDNIIVDPELSDYTDSSGESVSVTWHGYGGGLYAEGGTLVVEDCLFHANEAMRGGAIYARDTLFVQHGRFWGNTATDLGGALAVDDGIVTVDSSVFVDNIARGGASVYAADSTLLLSHLSIFDDSGLAADGALVEIDNVRGFWSNLILSAETALGVYVWDEASMVGLEGVLFDRIETPWDAYFRSLRVSGELLDADPRFMDASSDGDPSNDDLRLNEASPAVDAGLTGLDADGSPPDLGAYGGPNGNW